MESGKEVDVYNTIPSINLSLRSLGQELWREMDIEELKKIKILENSILQQVPIDLQIQEKNYVLLGHRLIILNGHLHYIGENLEDVHLMSLTVSSMENVSPRKEGLEAHYNSVEINQFI